MDLSITETGGLLTSNSKYYENYSSISTSIQVTDNLSLSSMKYEYFRKKTDYSESERTININNTFFPLGANGRGGLPMFNYSINLNGLEKFWGLGKWFKSISLSHNYSGSEAKTYKDYQGVLTLEKVDFSKDFSPFTLFENSTIPE